MNEPRKTRPADSSRRIGKLERRRQLLGHAKQAFLERGYRGTTLEGIAEAAGVSETVLHRHFPEKHDLFLEFLRELRQATLEAWRNATADATDPLAKLHAITDTYLNATRTQAAEFRILHRALIESDDAEVTAGLRSFYLECESLLAQIIGEGQQSGVFRRNLDPRVAWELIRSALGHTLTSPLQIPLHQEPDFDARAIDCLLHALLKVDV